MKRTLFIGCLIALLSACGTDLSETDLSTTGFTDVPMVTDSERIAEGLGAAGFETILTEPDNLLEVHQEVQGGLVSYTPLPPEINPWWPWPFPWPWWNPFDPCDPRYCDPVDPLIGWQFEGAYITPKFAETLSHYGVSAQKAAQLDGIQLTTLLDELRIEIYVTKVICDGLTSECKFIKVPLKPEPGRVICPVCGVSEINEGEPVKDFFGADLIFTGNVSLDRIEAELGNLIQLQGEGVAPIIQGLNVAVHPEVGKEMGVALAETLLGEEVQGSLYEHAGVLPVNANLLGEVMDEHIEGALEHGTVSADPLPVFFGKESTGHTTISIH